MTRLKNLREGKRVTIEKAFVAARITLDDETRPPPGKKSRYFKSFGTISLTTFSSRCCFSFTWDSLSRF